ELEGPDFNRFRSALNKAINGMWGGIQTYSDLMSVAAVMPYNQEVIDKLKTFNYDDFGEGKNLHGEVFQQVRDYLSRGDVNGAHEKSFLDMVDLLYKLETLKQEIDENIVPDIAKFWELNQSYSNALFFGQYVAMVFKNK
ncbi:MAG: hypothetical protein GY940_03830, partial [bacterium]|nr:hypothetical protein [bacterium]